MGIIKFVLIKDVKNRKIKLGYDYIIIIGISQMHLAVYILEFDMFASFFYSAR